MGKTLSSIFESWPQSFIRDIDVAMLKELSEDYPSLRVRKGLKKILGALS